MLLTVVPALLILVVPKKELDPLKKCSELGPMVIDRTPGVGSATDIAPELPLTPTRVPVRLIFVCILHAQNTANRPPPRNVTLLLLHPLKLQLALPVAARLRTPLSRPMMILPANLRRGPKNPATVL